MRVKSTTTDFEDFIKDEEAWRLYVQERTIGELTEAVCLEMRRQKVTQSELARRLGKTKGQVSQMLSGGRNLTLRSLSDILLALGRSLEPLTRPAEEPKGRYLRIPASDENKQLPKRRYKVN